MLKAVTGLVRLGERLSKEENELVWLNPKMRQGVPQGSKLSDSQMTMLELEVQSLMCRVVVPVVLQVASNDEAEALISDLEKILRTIKNIHRYFDFENDPISDEFKNWINTAKSKTYNFTEQQNDCIREILFNESGFFQGLSPTNAAFFYKICRFVAISIIADHLIGDQNRWIMINLLDANWNAHPIKDYRVFLEKANPCFISRMVTVGLETGRVFTLLKSPMVFSREDLGRILEAYAFKFNEYSKFDEFSSLWIKQMQKYPKDQRLPDTEVLVELLPDAVRMRMMPLVYKVAVSVAQHFEFLVERLPHLDNEEAQYWLQSLKSAPVRELESRGAWLAQELSHKKWTVTNERPMVIEKVDDEMTTKDVSVERVRSGREVPKETWEPTFVKDALAMIVRGIKNKKTAEDVCVDLLDAAEMYPQRANVFFEVVISRDTVSVSSVMKIFERFLFQFFPDDLFKKIRNIVVRSKVHLQEICDGVFGLIRKHRVALESLNGGTPTSLIALLMEYDSMTPEKMRELMEYVFKFSNVWFPSIVAAIDSSLKNVTNRREEMCEVLVFVVRENEESIGVEKSKFIEDLFKIFFSHNKDPLIDDIFWAFEFLVTHNRVVPSILDSLSGKLRNPKVEKSVVLQKMHALIIKYKDVDSLAVAEMVLRLLYVYIQYAILDDEEFFEISDMMGMLRIKALNKFEDQSIESNLEKTLKELMQYYPWRSFWDLYNKIWKYLALNDSRDYNQLIGSSYGRNNPSSDVLARDLVNDTSYDVWCTRVFSVCTQVWAIKGVVERQVKLLGDLFEAIKGDHKRLLAFLNYMNGMLSQKKKIAPEIVEMLFAKVTVLPGDNFDADLVNAIRQFIAGLTSGNYLSDSLDVEIIFRDEAYRNQRFAAMLKELSRTQDINGSLKKILSAISKNANHVLTEEWRVKFAQGMSQLVLGNALSRDDISLVRRVFEEIVFKAEETSTTGDLPKVGALRAVVRHLSRSGGMSEDNDKVALFGLLIDRLSDWEIIRPLCQDVRLAETLCEKWLIDSNPKKVMNALGLLEGIGLQNYTLVGVMSYHFRYTDGINAVAGHFVQQKKEKDQKGFLVSLGNPNKQGGTQLNDSDIPVLSSRFMPYFAAVINPGAPDTYDQHGADLNGFTLDELLPKKMSALEVAYQKVVDMCKQYRIPYLGICAGCQALALNYDAEIKRTTDHDGIREVKLLSPYYSKKEQSLIYYWSLTEEERKEYGKGALDVRHYMVIEGTKFSHGYSINPDTMNELLLTGRSPTDAIEAVETNTESGQMMIGVQFHPERACTDSNNEWQHASERFNRQQLIMQGFFDMVSRYHVMVRKAVSGGVMIDSEAMMQLRMNFITQERSSVQFRPAGKKRLLKIRK